MAGNVGKFGESSMIHETKLVLNIINNLLADLLIRQIFLFTKCL